MWAAVSQPPETRPLALPMAVRTADPHWVLGTALSLYMQRFAPFRKMEDRGL